VAGHSWAWGAATTIQLSVHQVGAYNSSSFGASSNLTTAGAFVDLSASVTAREASYAVVAASAPSAGNVTLEVAEAQFQGIALNETVSGALPIAGSYAPNATIPLANQTDAIGISEQILDVAAAFLNYTVSANNSVALTNEHLEYARFVNISLDAQHFPNVTANAAGGMVLRYDSGAVSASGFEGLNLTGTFAPGLILVQRPLTNSSQWSETVQATWNGTVAYASNTAIAVPGGAHAQTHQAAVAQFYRSAPLNLSATANGTQSILAPNGTRTTETVLDYVLSAPGGGATVVDGLFVVPSANATATSTGLAAVVPEHPATAPLASSAGPKTSALVPRSGGLPTGSIATTSTGTSTVATPMTPDSARSAIHQLEVPGPSTTAVAPSGNLAPLILLGVVVVAIGAVLVRRELRK
jgi:hypothetical protein